jgi:hypothetical protein
MNKLKYLKPTLLDNKVVTLESVKMKITGNSPAPRFGHSMAYLPVNQCLIVIGGRNDELCKSLNIPFLEDMFLFLLDLKCWIQVKYIPKSMHLPRIGNHSMAVISDGETTEKIIIFGGISNLKSTHGQLGN